MMEEKYDMSGSESDRPKTSKSKLSQRSANRSVKSRNKKSKGDPSPEKSPKARNYRGNIFAKKKRDPSGDGKGAGS